MNERDVLKLLIGVDPHKETHTAVGVVTGSGELFGELTVVARPSGYEELLIWAVAAGGERLWALEDVRGVSRGLEQFLLGHGERVVRVPPKLMAGARKSGRTFGKSDSIDALAIARAAIAHPDLPAAAPDEAARDLGLLANHREALVRQRSEAQDRLRWLLHDIDPDLKIPAGALDRKVWLERVTRRLGRGEQTVQVRIARDLVRRCKALTRDANELEREIGVRVARYAPQLLSLKGCGALIAAKIISETGGIGRFRNDAQFACLAGVAPIEASSGRQRRHRLSRHGNRQLNSALHKIAVVQGRWALAPACTSNAGRPRARPAAKLSAPSNATSPASSSGCCAKNTGCRQSESRCAGERSAFRRSPEAAVVVLMLSQSQPEGLPKLAG
jgi:transposase